MRRQHDKVCPVCNKQFKTIKASQITCSPECGTKRSHESVKKYYSCQYCGKPFWRENAFRMKYCSRECQYDAVKGQTLERHKDDPQPIVYDRVCPECQSVFSTAAPNHIYCSHDCTYAASLRHKREQWAEEYKSRTFLCKECGMEVTTECGDTHSVFCCQVCANRYENKLDKQTERHKEYMKLVKKKRNKQIAESFVEGVSYDVIFERDNGICQICGLPTIYDKFADNNWSGTIDHIVPLSVGGEHSINNCQLAHRICNSLKSNQQDFKGIDWECKARENNYWKQKYLQGLEAIQLLG